MDPSGATGTTPVPSPDGELRALSASSSDDSDISGDPRLTPQQRRNARIIWTLALDAGISSSHAREMISAAYGESHLLAKQPNRAGSGAVGLFQLLGAYATRAQRLGGVTDPRANTCAILPNFAAYWRSHPGVAPGVCAANVEASNSNASYYASALSWLPRTFQRIAVRPCPNLKPLCTKYLAGTRYAYPNCSLDGR